MKILRGTLRSRGYSESSIKDFILQMDKAEIIRSHQNPIEADPAQAIEGAAPAVLEDDLRHIACNKKIELFGPTLEPLVEQCPFLPEHIRDIRFSPDAKRIYQLAAPCGSGKSGTMAFLSCAAQSDGCWVLLLLNIANNQAVKGLAEKFFQINKALGIANRTFVETDDIFLAVNRDRLKRQCERVADIEARGTWICKANEKTLGKLLKGVSAEAWSRCVVMFDEVHCFFSLLDACKKKSELSMYRLLFGETRLQEDYEISKMRVRSVVFSDATDGDLPHVLQRLFKCSPVDDFTRICADHERMKARGYVSVADYRLFDGGLTIAQSKAHWFGKDLHQTIKGSGSTTFAEQITLDGFEPQLRKFCEDAFLVDSSLPVGGATTKRFMLELTSVNKSESGTNSVEHHAQAIARLFPGTLSLAEHGGGCFHCDQRGRKTRYANHREAHDALHATPDYTGQPKYLITNIGYGSITYGFAGAPVTHMYIGFKPNDNNILVKAQGAGRASGYVQKDLDRVGGHVKVLCTPEDFHDMQIGLPRFIQEEYAQYPNHATGAYTGRIVTDSIIGHASNPLSAMARSLATVSSHHGGFAEKEEHERSHLYASVEAEVYGLDINDGPGMRILSEKGTIVVSEAHEYNEMLRGMFPDALMTTRVVFVTGSDAQLTLQENDPMAINTDIGKAVRAEQTKDLPIQTPKSGRVWSSDKAHLCFYMGNPAHHGSKGGKNPETKYRMHFSYDKRGRQMLGVIRTVALKDLTLPFVHQRMEINRDGAICVKAFLVTEGDRGARRVKRSLKAVKKSLKAVAV